MDLASFFSYNHLNATKQFKILAAVVHK